VIKPLNSLGMGLIFLFLLLGVCQKGRTEEKYTVKPGDTLYGISKSFGVRMEALKRANASQAGSHHSLPKRNEGG
jgi:hypothetical protein